MSKRAIRISNSEISAVIWLMSLLFTVIALVCLYNMVKPALKDPGIMSLFMLITMMLLMSIIFSLASMAMPNYQISKHNLNLLIDRITNPDFMGWIRFTRNKKILFQIVKNGPLGQTKGLAHGEKADVNNDGSYTVITPSGNQAIIVNDLSSHNINMDRAMGWNLIHKHFGIVGFRAWEKAAEDKKLIYKKFSLKKAKEEKAKREEAKKQ
ncbi:MAG: hypothetical protein IMZ52_10055 [Actinobacteria bacterium]|nr:hypothetical protein [Actinomycetota bacterium]MBE3122591.1 hypothetical protein [Thermoplasmata archaeon]